MDLHKSPSGYINSQLEFKKGSIKIILSILFIGALILPRHASQVEMWAKIMIFNLLIRKNPFFLLIFYEF